MRKMDLTLWALARCPFLSADDLALLAGTGARAVRPTSRASAAPAWSTASTRPGRACPCTTWPPPALSRRRGPRGHPP